MKCIALIGLVCSLSFTNLVNAQYEYVSKSAYKADISYLEKLEASEDINALIMRLRKVYEKSTIELEYLEQQSEELQKLQADVRDFIAPRPASYHNVKIEKKIVDNLLKITDIVFVESVNLQNDDWKLSQGGTYKYYEFDAVGKSLLNNYILLNGYYKIELSRKTSSLHNRARDEAYVYVEYKRSMTYKNYFHRLIRK
ncbi:MAG: hypothetical protein PHP52_01550 [Bacteroidales bacterium]|jgi:hypothetical protein|nr:hypothetical protein [Bacteroidales bacterium]MDD4218026.1 hypothetical protein [Bacteroidales bacterium]MDY0140433.1 hypothetical protein [Bacteroidales bacterium]